MKESTQEDNRIRKQVDAAFQVQKDLEPRLLESVYEACLCHKLKKGGLGFERQAKLPIEYDGVVLTRSAQAGRLGREFCYL